ncbi:hypothetical protein [Streptomyces peucetius]|uniref:Uncharacterized protein n=1 Tax=Streptomyces peucetius TaxID=1950 RepID=A0ABY6I070_STRPE|nr:hypothetical protein [Streptomyces peucetius]UYQ60231.1 hypothetical protein OGH68_01215 [Streptomyces peucetius]
MLSHALDRGVLVVTVHQDPGISRRAELATRISSLVHAHKPAPVVIVLEDHAATNAAVSAVLRAHRLCSHLDTLMSVATHSAPARRLLEANADAGSHRLVVHSRIDIAISAANTAAAA